MRVTGLQVGHCGTQQALVGGFMTQAASDAEEFEGGHGGTVEWNNHRQFSCCCLGM